MKELSRNFTPEDLQKFVDAGIKSNVEFKHPDYDKMNDLLWMVLHEATASFRSLLEKLESVELPEKEFAFQLILNNCLVDLYSANHSLRAGFQRPSATTARGALENLAMVLAMKLDQTDTVFENYKKGTYSIPKAVSATKEIFPILGPVYGVLSNTFAHEPYEAIGRAFIEHDDSTFMLLVPPVGRENFLSHSILCLKIATLAETFGSAAEFIFANWLMPEVYWVQEEWPKLRSRKTVGQDSILKLTAIVDERIRASEASRSEKDSKD